MKSQKSSDRALDRYVAEIHAYPLLSREEEYALAQRYQEQGDEAAAHRLVTCNLRFVIKTAHQYRGYGLKLLDLIQEGNLGLMMAVKKFNPDKGNRLVSYAVWWIRAYMQSFIMRSWSLIKVGTTQAQRKLFYRLRSEMERQKKEMDMGADESTRNIAASLNVSEGDVRGMEVRLCQRDFSLDTKLSDEGHSTHLDYLADVNDSQEQQVAAGEMRDFMRRELKTTMTQLNDKELYVTQNRILAEEPPTLNDLGKSLNVSRERVRQIEGNVIRKLRAAFVARGVEVHAA